MAEAVLAAPRLKQETPPPLSSLEDIDLVGKCLSYASEQLRKEPLGDLTKGSHHPIPPIKTSKIPASAVPVGRWRISYYGRRLVPVED